MSENTPHVCCLGEDCGHQIIEVRIGTIGQFYQTLDPSPDLEKDLNPDTVEYLIDTTEEMKNQKEEVHIDLYLENSLFQNTELKSRMEKSIPAYFSRRVDILEHKHRMSHKKARKKSHSWTCIPDCLCCLVGDSYKLC